MKAILAVLLVVMLASSAQALTVNDVIGTYSAKVTTWSEARPTSITTQLQLLSTGIWTLLCQENIGGSLFVYPCEFGVWSIRGQKQDVVVIDLGPAEVLCEQLNIDTMWCTSAGVVGDLVLYK